MAAGPRPKPGRSFAGLKGAITSKVGRIRQAGPNDCTKAFELIHIAAFAQPRAAEPCWSNQPIVQAVSHLWVKDKIHRDVRLTAIDPTRKR